jgi:2-methylisocitrate lyase-like PEP mutase family enzyme
MATDKGAAFRALHDASTALVMPNPWDAGSAVLLSSLGFQALATTSAGMAFALGRTDGEVSWNETLLHCRQIVAATNLPVSADLERGIGDTPEEAAETVRRAAEIGLAGCSLEDFSGNPDQPIYDLDLAVERIRAASEAARSLPHDFVLTARAENFFHGRPDLDDTIRRLEAFEAAGADVLFAPGLPDLEAIRLVCSSVSKPVSVMYGMSRETYGVDALVEVGVRRISLGPALAAVAYGAAISAARHLYETGNLVYPEPAASFGEIAALMTAAAPDH